MSNVPLRSRIKCTHVLPVCGIFIYLVRTIFDFWFFSLLCTRSLLLVELPMFLQAIPFCSYLLVPLDVEERLHLQELRPAPCFYFHFHFRLHALIGIISGFNFHMGGRFFLGNMCLSSVFFIHFGRFCRFCSSSFLLNSFPQAFS